MTVCLLSCSAVPLDGWLGYSRNAAGSDLVDNPALGNQQTISVRLLRSQRCRRGQDKFMVAILFNSADAASKEYRKPGCRALLGRGGSVQDQAIEAVAIAYSSSTVGEDLGVISRRRRLCWNRP